MQTETAQRDTFWTGVTVLAAALGGFALLLWLAANWDGLGLLAQSLLLQGIVIGAAATAAVSPRLRSAAAVIAFCAVGGLLAWLGQTYHSSADSWQLFTLWTIFTLPLCLALRSDVLWLPWVVVAGSTVALWLTVNALAPYEAAGRGNGVTHAIALAAAALPLLLTATPLRRYSGAGAGALRTAVLVLAAIALWISFTAISEHLEAGYYFALAALAAAAVVLAQRAWFDLLGLSLLVLALDAVAVIGIAHAVFKHVAPAEGFVALLLIGLLALAVLVVSSLGLHRIARSQPALAHTGTGDDA